ncbi:autotransporter domain-containing protein [Plastorhodobacter daqingensis]|uniref:Autotransporter domain-containing protein n=1 Tax=Plastorhodobacter daqingensis TaxID=1387281 RepID=A0ABW2ULP0_9RHOB
MINEFSCNPRSARPCRRLLCSAAFAALLVSPASVAAQSHDDTLRLLTYNVWTRFNQNVTGPAQFLAKGDYDVILMQEAGSNKRYVSDLPDLLENAGLGTYQGATAGSSALLSRLPGTIGTHRLPDIPTQGRDITWAQIKGAGGRPGITVGAVHFDYGDSPARRVAEAQALNAWAKGLNAPLIMGGDFNAGDVAERGLHRAEQQSYLFARMLMRPGSNALWGDLAQQYIPEGREEQYAAYVAAMQAVEENGQPRYMNVLQEYFAQNRDEFPGITSINNMSWRQWETIIAHDMARNGITFDDEIYPVAGNTPVTMNVLKQQFMLLQTEAERELFAPHPLGDGRSTWPSVLEDDENTWHGWDRVRIDHFLAARPFGKWFAIVSDPNDPYLGTIRDITVERPDGTPAPLSDHDLVAHEVRWIGPRLETFGDDQTRLAWDAQATTWGERGGEFLLSRNNMRTDVYLGQIADANGNPILTDLTEAERTTLLDCTTSDPRFQQAVLDYCIDDHSFIGETLVADGGTILITEDAALGNADAQLRLNGGGLAMLGTSMTALDRAVVLEGQGGWLDVRDEAGRIDASGVISGSGDLIKRGDGQLVLSATNTYSGGTMVERGALIVNGSIAGSGLMTVADGARLGGTGTTASVAIASGGTLGAGNSIGTLTIDGNLSFAQGAIFEVETDADGNTDRVDVTGRAVINGGSVLALSEAGAYALNTEYQILTAPGGITGTFDSVRSSLAFLDARLRYGSTSLGLNLERNDTAFRTVATSGNSRATADALERLGAGNALFDRVVMLGGETARATFTDLSGEMNVAAFGALADQSVLVGDIWRQNAQTPAEGTTVWIGAYGKDGTAAGSSDLFDVNRDTVGTLFGVNAATAGGVNLGGMVGFGHGSLSLDGASGRIDTDDLHLGLSLGTQIGATSLRGGASFSRSRLSGHRDLRIGPSAERASVSGTMDTTHLFAEVEHRVAFDTLQLIPFARLGHVHVAAEGLRETGSAAALRVEDSSYNATYGDLGARLQTALGPTGATRLRADLAYRTVFSGDEATVGLAFAGGDTFDISAVGMTGDVATVGFGIDYDLNDTTVLSTRYSGAFGERNTASAISLSLGMRF